MKKIIWSILIIALIAAAAYFAYPIIRDRYFPDQASTDAKPKPRLIFSSGSDSTSESDPQTQDQNGTEQSGPGKIPADIDQSDCENECADFSDPDEFKYCRSFCGQTDPATTTNDCESKTGLEQDYCWKDKAILEKNFGFCDKISDKPIRESCQIRLTEDLLEQQQSQ